MNIGQYGLVIKIQSAHVAQNDRTMVWESQDITAIQGIVCPI